MKQLIQLRAKQMTTRSMRQRHFAGEKLFVDYASGYAYAEATRTATLPDWLGSHVRMLEF